MPLFMLDVVGAPAALSGMLSRRLLEIRAGLFVGSLPAREVEAIWSAVENSATRSAALIFPAKNELDLSIRTIGASRYRIVDCDGLPLIAFDRRKKTN